MKRSDERLFVGKSYSSYKDWLEDNVVNVKNSAIMKLPRYEEAVIPEEKFVKYALNPERAPNKSKAFKDALGYDKENYKELIEDIRKNLPNFNAVKKKDTNYGVSYEVVMDLTGPNGKTAKVLTAWLNDKETGKMRLVTVHVDK